MSTIGWIVIGAAFLGLHFVMHRGHSAGGHGDHARHRDAVGGCCGGEHGHAAADEEVS